MVPVAAAAKFFDADMDKRVGPGVGAVVEPVDDGAVQILPLIQRLALL